jgi:hypothetical protein
VITDFGTKGGNQIAKPVEKESTVPLPKTNN